MRFLLIIAAVLIAPLAGFSAERPSDERLDALAREYANRINPTLNQERLSFGLTRLTIPGLWEQMGAELVDVAWLIDGKWFNGYVGLYRDGKLTVLATNLGGHGFMSGMVSKGALYFTYSWGSGIHRSHIGKLEIVDGKLVVSDSGGFMDVDVFVRAKLDGSVGVYAGQFAGVNDWKESVEMGTVRQESPVRLGVVGPSGKLIEPAFKP